MRFRGHGILLTAALLAGLSLNLSCSGGGGGGGEQGDAGTTPPEAVLQSIQSSLQSRDEARLLTNVDPTKQDLVKSILSKASSSDLIAMADAYKNAVELERTADTITYQTTVQDGQGNAISCKFRLNLVDGKWVIRTL